MDIRSQVTSLYLGCVSTFYKQYCPVSVRLQTNSLIIPRHEGALESMKHTRSSWLVFPRASVANVKGLMLMETVIRDC